MPTLTIGDRKVTVDDSFLNLSPEQQNATVEEIASTLAAPDKYQQAALDERAKLKPDDAGYTRRLIHGVTLGADSTIAAAALTPLEMIRQGTLDPREGYNYAKAREDLTMNQARQNTGAVGTATELLGGGVAGGALAPLGASRLLSAAPSLAARSGAMAADGAVLGGVTGFNEGNGFLDRITQAGTGAAVGGAVGGVLPTVGTVVKGVASPLVSNVAAWWNPRGYAAGQVARGITESGRPTADIANDVVNAASEGQGVYTLADAMGNPGQRLLSTVARAPGEGRTAAVEFLENRQAGQGRRVSNTLAEGFDSPQTAAQTEARVTQARDARADAEYGAVGADADPVDLTNTINRIDAIVPPGAKGNAAPDSVEAALANVRSRLTDNNSQVIDFPAIQRIRGDLSDAVGQAQRQGAGNKARLLGQVLREMDTAMEAASPGFRQANANFAQGSRAIEAVGEGRAAALRGRTEDTVPAFRAMPADQQAAFRAGYVDPLIEQTQGGAMGVNKARPFTSDAFRDEAAAIAPMRTGPQMTRRLDRETRMFETRNQALGNSKTAENLADADAMGALPSLVGQVISGNWPGAARSVIAAGSNLITGNTPAVRAEVARILLQRGANVTPAALDQMVGDTIRRIQAVQRLARNAARGAAGAAAVAPEATRKPKAAPIFSR